MPTFLNYIINAFAFGIVFLFGSVGEIITEKSGHLNLGIPGVMCVGAMTGCVAVHAVHGMNLPGFLVVIIGIAASLIGGALMGALYSFMTVTLHSNQNVTGLIMTTFGAGFTKFVMPSLSAPNYLYAKAFFRFPFSDRNDALQYCGVMLYIAVIIAIIASLVLSRTRVGLHLRAVGENPATADAAGINVQRYRYLATMVGCAIAGLGGLFYVFAQSLSLFGIKASLKDTTLIEMLPYIITLLVLIVTSIKNKKSNQPPAGLGLNYYREDR